MLLIAKKRQTDKQKIFLILDEENLPFNNKQFNLVFSNLYLHWSNDLFKVLNEIYRILKPDGLFLCSIFGSETLNELKYSLISLQNIKIGCQKKLIYKLSNLIFFSKQTYVKVLEVNPILS